MVQQLDAEMSLCRASDSTGAPSRPRGADRARSAFSAK
jgi:hypothetical protein